jgi:hypothetical protein
MAVPKLQYAIGNSASTTLSVAAANSDTSMTITSDTNFAAKSGEGMVIIDEAQATEELAYSASKSGAVLSVPLVNRGLEGGSAQGHAINATVKGILSAGMWNDMITSLLNFLDQTTGAVDTTKILTLTGTQTTTNKTLTSPVINTGISGTAITDEDDMVSDSATKVPTEQSVKAHVASGTVTMTNKRITPRVVTATDDATAVIDVDVTDQYQLTAVANATEFTVSGTPVTGQKLIIRLKDAGVAKALTWTGFTAVGVTLPTTTVANKTHYVGCIYNSAGTTWDAVAVVVTA